MAFVNEKVPNGEREKLVEMGLWSFLGTFPGNNIDNKELMPYAWTRDEENDIVLLKGNQYCKPPYESKFGLLWKGKLIEFVLLQERKDNNDIIWEMQREEIPPEFINMKDKLIEKLKEALKVYGMNGSFLPQYNCANEVKILF